PGPAPAEVVQGGEEPGEVVRLEVGGGRGADQPDPFGGHGDARQPGERLEPEPAGVPDVVRQRRPVGEEDRVELGRLGAAGELLVVGYVQDAVRGGPGVPAGGLVVPGRVDGQVEVQLRVRGGHGLSSPVTPSAASRWARTSAKRGSVDSLGESRSMVRSVVIRPSDRTSTRSASTIASSTSWV